MTGLTKLEQLLAFCDWERKHYPHPAGKPHIAEWAYAEIVALHDELLRVRKQVEDDALAATFQTLGQYRSALLAAMRSNAIAQGREPGLSGEASLGATGYTARETDATP